MQAQKITTCNIKHCNTNNSRPFYHIIPLIQSNSMVVQEGVVHSLWFISSLNVLQLLHNLNSFFNPLLVCQVIPKLTFPGRTKLPLRYKKQAHTHTHTTNLFINRFQHLMGRKSSHVYVWRLWWHSCIGLHCLAFTFAGTNVFQPWAEVLQMYLLQYQFILFYFIIVLHILYRYKYRVLLYTMWHQCTPIVTHGHNTHRIFSISFKGIMHIITNYIAKLALTLSCHLWPPKQGVKFHPYLMKNVEYFHHIFKYREFWKEQAKKA